MSYLGKKTLLEQEKLKKAKLQQQQVKSVEHMSQLTEIHKNFQSNLHTFAAKYKDNINSDPDFREKFNELCDKMDVNPMLSRKTIWTDLGFGDFYNELAIKILDLCGKKQQINGGVTKVSEIVVDFRKVYKMKITKDIQRALKTIDSLGGCSIQNEYVYTVPIELSPDFTTLIEVAELYGFVNESIMQKEKNWPTDRFYRKIEILQREGMVWIDKKTSSTAKDYYFPSLLDSYFENQGKFKKL